MKYWQEIYLVHCPSQSQAVYYFTVLDTVAWGRLDGLQLPSLCLSLSVLTVSLFAVDHTLSAVPSQFFSSVMILVLAVVNCLLVWDSSFFSY